MPPKQRKSKRITFPDTVVLSLFSEVNGICPRCSCPLLYEKGRSKAKMYEIAHIFPLNPSASEAALLRGVVRLANDVNDQNNLILLCRNCHRQFDAPRTVDDYNSMVALKTRHINKTNFLRDISSFSIEKEIAVVLDALLTEQRDHEVQPLSFSAKYIAKKADASLTAPLEAQIRHQITDYFTFVQESLKALDAASPGASDKIAQQVKLYYTHLKVRSVSQYAIYTSMVSWLEERTRFECRTACEVIISFFVQNCEVFE
jgi:HNH endonuclease